MSEPVRVQVASAFKIEVTILDENGDPLDISGASAKYIRVKLPGGSATDRTADFVTDGDDGKLEVTISAADNTVTGTARCQGKVTLSGNVYYSTPGSIDIKPNVS